MIRNVIFDWSGTLVDDLPAVWGATNDVLRDFKLPELTLDQFRLHFRLPFMEFYHEFAGSVPLPQLEERFHARFRLRQDTVKVLTHAREFLEFCRRHGLRTFVLSTILNEYYVEQSTLNGFAEFIDHPYLGARDKRLKIGGILSTHGLDPSQTLFIGDMQHDIDTARHGGVRSCAVLTGYNNLDQLRTSEPDLIVEHLGELQNLLERHALELPARAGRALAAHDRQPVVTVGALVYNDVGQVLLVRTRKWSNLWGIPGGKVKYGETSEAALRREIKEETNLDLVDVRFVLAQDCIESEEFYRPAHFVLLNYTARRHGPLPVRLNEEAEDFRWVEVNHAMAMSLNRPTRVLLEAILKAGE